MSYLAPEHIALALLVADDGGVTSILKRCTVLRRPKTDFPLQP